VIWGAVAAVAAVLLFVIVWIGARGVLAKQHLEASAALARTTMSAMAGGGEVVAADVDALTRHAAEAGALTSDPIWRAAEAVPWIGPNLESVRVIAQGVDDLAWHVVEPLTQAAAELDTNALRAPDGRLEVARVAALTAPVSTAWSVLDDVSRRLADGPADDDLLAPISNARNELAALLDETTPMLDGMNRAVHVLPLMLGNEGPREILLLFQNNAELRSTGGIPGALALVRAEAGKIELVQQANSSDFPRFDPPVVELPVETRALWGENTARYIQDVTFSPQFALGASVAREMWAREFGSAPESVVALDPVVLSYLLRATGPISLPTGDQLTADNAVQLLLRDVYDRYEIPADQDAFFAGAAAAVLAAVSGGNVDPRALIDALVQGADERRILIWNADPSEQAILDGTTLVGGLPVSGAKNQAFGVYLNDMTMSKMDAYLDVRISAGAEVCRQDGLPEYAIDVSLTNTAPQDAGTSLPEYVTGGDAASVEPGNIATSVHVYSAPGTFNLGATQNGQPAAYSPTTEAGYTISKVTANLAPGETESWRFMFLGDVAEKRKVVIQSTPMIYKSEVSSLALSCG
jgi:hypothetical protein